jgi:hypothetical protein
MQERLNRKGERFHANTSRISAIAAGSACTKSILWLTVAAP